MTISEGMLPELDQELANTRKILERVPQGRMDYRPHPKSWTLGGLATHVATLPGWTSMTIGRSELDIAPVGEGPMRVPEAKTPAELLTRFDEHASAARASLAGASDATMLGPWTLLAGGNAIFTMPRVAVMRTFVMNHLIHHRAQLGVYLRMCDVPLPNLYGPTADEGGM